MFNKKDMMVSLIAVEEKINGLKEEYENSYVELNEKLVDFINKSKEVTGYIGEAECEDISYKCPIGHDTGYEIGGIKVYTGDEIRLISVDPYLNGKIGLATIVNGRPYWQSNAECGYMNKSIRYEFVNHFVHYKDGDEVAKGRSGARGFIVKKKQKEYDSEPLGMRMSD